MAELKPCPFCGGTVSIARAGDNGMMWWFVTRDGKSSCKCRVFMESEDFSIGTTSNEKLQLRNDLIKAWNRRTEDGT